MSEQSTESPGTKPAKETAESLNDQLWAKADAELMAIIDRHINLNGLEEEVAYVQSPAWKTILNLNVSGHGVLEKVEAPAMITASKEATFLALRDYYRNRYVAAFIRKINSMQAELESLQAQVG